MDKRVEAIPVSGAGLTRSTIAPFKNIDARTTLDILGKSKGISAQKLLADCKKLVVRVVEGAVGRTFRERG